MTTSMQESWIFRNYPKVSDGLPRPSTVVLFGCWIADCRIDAGMTTLDMADLAHRSEDWLASVEAGQCVPTPSGYNDLTEAFESPRFDKLRGAVGRIDAADIARELELDPWGKTATQLRKTFGISVGEPTFDQPRNEDSSLLGHLSEIRHRDRLLSLTPVLGLAVVSGFLMAGKPWEAEPTFQWPNFDAVTFVGFSIFTALSLQLRVAGQILDVLAASMRWGKRRKYYKQAKSLRRDENSPAPSQRGWYWPGEDPYIVTTYRDRARSLTIEADLTERAVIVWSFALVGIGAAAGEGMVKAGSASAHKSWIAAWLAIFGLTLVTRIRNKIVCDAAREALLFGYGAPHGAPDRYRSLMTRLLLKIRSILVPLACAHCTRHKGAES